MTREVRAAWSAALLATLLNSGGMVIELFIVRSIPGMPLWPPIASAIVGLILGVILLATRRHATVAFASACFIVNTIAIASSLWLNNTWFAQNPEHWWPFQESKLGCMAVALLTPDRFAGLASIAIYSGAALIQYWTFPPEVRAELALGEPWATVAFGSFNAILLVHRLRRLELEHEIEKARADALTAERLRRVSMAVRDLANTPLQTIHLSAALIDMRAPEVRAQTARIDSALRELRRMNEILDEQDASYPSQHDAREDLSFDALAILRQAQESARSRLGRRAS